jgi:hypothetical protein
VDFVRRDGREKRSGLRDAVGLANRRLEQLCPDREPLPPCDPPEADPPADDTDRAAP